MKENPFLYYHEKANELGINDRILIARILISSKENEKMLETKCDNVLIQQEFVPQIYYYSKLNFKQFSLIASMDLIINRKKGEREFDSIVKLFNPDYFFALCSEQARGHDYIGFDVKGSKIIKLDIKLDRIKEFPENLFTVKSDYKPALDWMLEEYVKGLK